MAAPTFVQEAETVWNTTADKTTGSFSVTSGDILVAIGIRAHWYTPGITAFAISDSQTNAYTLRQNVTVADYTEVAIWTATAGSTGSMTVSLNDGAETAQSYGLNVFTISDSDGVGASSKTNVASGAPTLNITTTQANSIIVVANSDWNAADGASRTWRANAGALTEQSYFRDASLYAVYVGYHADAGAIGTYAVGLSAPTGQKYSIAAIEIKGTAAASNTRRYTLTTLGVG